MKVFYPRFSREQVLAHLRERLPALAEKLPLQRAVLFGSYAKGNFAVGSDIDLLVIYQGERNEAGYALCKKILDLPGLEPHLFTQAESLNQKQMIARMTDPGVVLFP